MAISNVTYRKVKNGFVVHVSSKTKVKNGYDYTEDEYIAKTATNAKELIDKYTEEMTNNIK